MATLAEAVDKAIPTVSWSELLNDFEWYQGEHLTAIGPTKSGKSTLIRHLMARARELGTHPWQVVFKTKRKDETLDEFEREGFIELPDWLVSDPDVTPLVMLAPPLEEGAASKNEQREKFRQAMVSIYKQGGWLTYADEFKHVAKYLSLEADSELLIHQGRSAGITVVASLQRPRHVPLMAYDQATHLFFWESRDHKIRERLSEISGRVDPDVVQQGVQRLREHQFLYVNPMTGQITQSEVEL